MNILIVTPYFYEPPGGKYGVMRLSMEFSKRNHKVYVISTRVRNSKAYEEFNGVKVYRKKPVFYIPSLPYAMQYLVPTIIKFIKKYEIEVLHTQTIHYTSSLSVAIASKMLNFPFILSVLGSTLTFCRSFIDLIFNLYESTISKCVVNRAKMIISISEHLIPRLYNLGVSPNKIRVIPHGINASEYKPKKRGHHFRNLLGIKPTELVIGYVGRLVPLKGVSFLIDAFKIVSGKNSNAKLLIVGDGPQRKQLEYLSGNMKSEKKIIFTGFVPKERMPEIYNTLDIFVLPSFTEGLSNTLLEAMASGKPIITTPVGGNTELIENGKNGYLVHTRSVKELAERILDLLNAPNERTQMGKAGRTKILNQYTWEKIIPRYEKVYKQVLNGSF